MRNKSTNTTLLILTILLCLVVAGLGAYTYSFHTKVKENETQLVKNMLLLKAELKEEIDKYSLLLEEKKALSSELIIAKERLEILQKMIDSNEITSSVVHQYQIEIRQLREEWKVLFNQNDILKQEARRFFNLHDHTQNSLDSITKKSISLPIIDIVIKDRPEVIVPETQIKVTNLQAYGVIQRRSGKFASTSRATRAQMVRVCYVVEMTELSYPSERIFYVRVIAKNDKLIGIERKITLEMGNKLAYNTETNIGYQSQPYTICELVLPIKAFNKGDYKVEIYNSKGLLKATNLILK